MREKLKIKLNGKVEGQNSQVQLDKNYLNNLKKQVKEQLGHPCFGAEIYRCVPENLYNITVSDKREDVLLLRMQEGNDGKDLAKFNQYEGTVSLLDKKCLALNEGKNVLVTFEVKNPYKR